MKTPTEHLEKFIEALLKDKAVMSEVKKYLTLTQQNESIFVGGVVPEASINGLYHNLQHAKNIKVKAIPTSNKVMVDCVISYEDIMRKKKLKMQCRLIKESGTRKPNVNGQWGVHANSFKII